MGAEDAQPNGVNSGQSFVVFGSSEGAFGSVLELSSLDGNNGFAINGITAGDNSGISVSGAGDVNGDGIADLIVGADGADPNGSAAGQSFVVFGSSEGAIGSVLELSSLDGSNGFVINGIAGSDFAGTSVSGAGDVNGDGFDDLIVGADGADPNGESSGQSFVVFGSSEGALGSVLELSSLDGSNGFALNGIAPDDSAGIAVSGAGDVNGDGFDDLVVGANGADANGSDSGQSFVVFGAAPPPAIADQTILEDGTTGPLSFTVEDLDTPLDELVVTGSSSNPDLVPDDNIVITGDGGDRTVTVTPTADQSGNATITLTVSDGELEASETFELTVSSVNDAPSFELPTAPDQLVNEDSGLQTIANFATNISPGGGTDEAAQILSFTLESDNAALFDVQPSIDPTTGTLTFTPSEDATGTTTVTVSLSDDGGTANGGSDTSSEQTFDITLAAVNDAPSFELPTEPDQLVNEDSGLQTIANFATSISPGGGTDEAAQILSFTVESDNAALFDVQPSIDPTTGTLTFTPSEDAAGTTTITVSLSDDGGTANGGSDTSSEQTFDITLAAVNEAPSFELIESADITVDEDSGPQTIANFATNISPGGGLDEADQALTFTLESDETANQTVVFVLADNDTLFEVQPSIDPVTGNLTFTPAANENGSAEITVTLSDDGGTANGGSDTSLSQTFNINVTALNDAPSFELPENPDISVDEDSGLQIFSFATNITPGGGSDEALQELSFNLSNDNEDLFALQPTLNPDSGNLTFVPAVGATGVATVTVSLSDDDGTPNGGSDTSPTQTFTIAVNEIDEFLTGDGGDNLLDGDTGNDTLDGSTGIDTLLGGSGDDLLISEGLDSLDGGSDGISGDTADFSIASAAVIIDLDVNSAGFVGTPSQPGNLLDSLPNDVAVDGVTPVENRLAAVNDIENAIGSAFDDGLFGNNEINRLEGGAGDDIIDGFLGNDVLSGGEGVDTLQFSGLETGVEVDLNQQVTAEEFTAIASGAIAATAFAAVGGAGNNVLSGFEHVSGSSSADDILGDAGDNQLMGNGGADTLLGSAGNDTLIGNGSRDSLNGGGGGDLLQGDGGLDSLFGAGGADTLVGGVGSDLLAGNSGSDSLVGEAGRDSLTGNGGQDTLDGGAGMDTLAGSGGADLLSGGSSDDLLLGGSGADTLFGGSGNDTLTGGNGADTFVITDGGTERITDFQNGTDQLGLDGIGFGAIAVISVGNNTLLEVEATGQNLAVLENIAAQTITAADFVTL